MKAIRIHQYGGPEALNFEQTKKPSINPTQVLIQVKAAAVNPVDYKIAMGTRKNVYPIEFPWIPGGDFSGIVIEVGKDITDFKQGDEVFGNSNGTYAEYLVTSPTSIAKKPAKLDFAQAASLPIAGLTAWQCLFDLGQLQAHQTVLIHGGSGGVGVFSVQLAHIKGAKVITTTSGENIEFVRSLGANEVIDYTKEPFEKKIKNVDLVIDLISGDTQKRSFTVLKKGGTLISTLGVDENEAKKYEVHAKSMRVQIIRNQLEKLAELVANGEVKVYIEKVLPLKNAKEAWEKIKTGHTRGKIILEVK